jgi:hypothetical protein
LDLKARGFLPSTKYRLWFLADGGMRNGKDEGKELLQMNGLSRRAIAGVI